MPEYPAARHLKDSIWACSDGFGNLYVVDAEKKAILSSHELLESDSNILLPFALNAATVSGSSGYAILSGSVQSHGSQSSSRPFRVDVVQFSLEAAATGTLPLQKVTQLIGTDLPTYTAFSNDKAILGSSAKYRPLASDTTVESSSAEASEQQASYEPKPDEIVGIPRRGEEPQIPLADAPPPYSWNQTSESVTVVFPLPTIVNVKDIKVVFRPKAVSLMIAGAGESHHKLPLPQLDTAKLWDEIDAGVSTWTWEKTGGDKGKFGILALHLEKKHEDTRWVHVFQQDENPHLRKEYFEVEETLDRSELAKITEAMEKFTQDLASTGVEGKSNFDQRSSLLGDELDIEVDAPDISNGKGVVFTWVSGIGSEQSRVEPDSEDEVVEHISTALPTAGPAAPSIIVKHDVDGLLFEPPSDPSRQWTHTSTYPALGFVLASKRDVVHVYHHSSRFAIGLEMGTSIEAQQSSALASYGSVPSSKMNAYLYFPPPPGSKAKTAPQKVVRLGEASAGAVLGAIALEFEGGLNVAVLCERELILMKRVL